MKTSLKQVIFYSPIFQNYFNEILESGFDPRNAVDLYKYNLNFEDQFKIFQRSFDERINLFFFLSFFYPLGFLYILTALQLSLMDIITLTVIFLVLSNFIIRSFTNSNNYMPRFFWC